MKKATVGWILLALLIFLSPAYAGSFGVQQLPRDAQTVKPAPTPFSGESLDQQLKQCWFIAPMPKPQAIGEVWVDAWLDRQGNITSIKLSSRSADAYKSDSAFRNIALSAMLALKQCSPIAGLPARDYERWKRLTLRFDIAAMMRDAASAAY